MSSKDYYVGHPATYTAPAPGTKQAPLQVAAGGEQTPVSTTQTPGATHNYFVGHPVNPEKTPTAQPAHPAAPPPPAQKKKRESLLARWFPCVCGSRAPEK